MGYIPCKSFSMELSKGRADADHVNEDAGFTGEWVTTVGKNAYGESIRFKRNGRPVFATRAEAVKWASEHKIAV